MTTTKEQERNTLSKIKKLVAELGKNSYLASAFTGAFELAELNIEDDAAYTTQYYIDKANSSYDTERDLNETKALLVREQGDHANTAVNFSTTVTELDKKLMETQNKFIEQYNARLSIEERFDTYKSSTELEINALKAKLYDLIIK